MNDFEKVIDFGSLYRGLKASCKNVRWKDSTIGYEANGLKNTYKLKQDILNGTYQLQEYQIFTIYEPKERRIVATRIRDRQFQHSLVDNIVYHQITKSFIVDNCACMKGRGVDYCLRRVKLHLGRYYRKHGCEGWVLRCDIKSYFDTIPHEVAKQAIRNNIKDTRVQNELFRIVDSYEHGLGLGSQVNQLLALLILSDLDHYIKEKLHIKHYVRYMDDLILICEDKERLKECLLEIEAKISELGLSLNKNKTTLSPLSHGFHILKWRFMLKPTGRIVMRANRRKVLKHESKIEKLWKLESVGMREQGTCNISMMSFMANMRRGDTYSERREVAEFYRKLTGRKFHDYVKRRTADCTT